MPLRKPEEEQDQAALIKAILFRACSTTVIMAAGWGGVWFISPKGVLLAHIQTPDFTSNTAIDDNGEYLYWTAGKLPFTKGSGALYRYKLK